jgi:hypothetical protein
VLEVCEHRGDLDNFEFRARVDFWVSVADVVQDVEHEGAVSGAHFVDYKVMVGVEGEFVVGDKIPGYCLAVVGTKEFGGSVPELASFIFFFRIEGIFKGDVALVEQAIEFRAVGHIVEVEWFARAEYNGLFGEITIVGVIQTVFMEILA